MLHKYRLFETRENGGYIGEGAVPLSEYLRLQAQYANHPTIKFIALGLVQETK